jgi:hypothetical protein
MIKLSNINPTICNVTQFIISRNCSTCFGWYLHPSSRAQTTVSTASGICHTVTATCRYTRCCRHSCFRFWWWVVVPPKTCRAVSRYNKLCNVPSCWIYIRILLRCTDTLPVKKIKLYYFLKILQIYLLPFIKIDIP